MQTFTDELKPLNFVFQKGSLNILTQACTKQRLFYQTFPTIIANSCTDTVSLRIGA